MRAIDADALWMDVIHSMDYCDDILEIIERQPTIEERKRGKWIPQNLNKSIGMISTAVYYYPKCSVCGANANFTNFCPNCGAEMEGAE